MMDGSPIHFLPIKEIVIAALGIAGAAIMGWTLLTNDADQKRSEQKIEISTGYEAQITIDGDTTKRIYILQDSTNGIVWIGVPGKNSLKK